MKAFLEKVWAIDSSELSSSKMDDILLDLIASDMEKDEISQAMKDIIHLMSAMNLNGDGGIFANGKYIKKDRVNIFLR